MFLVMDKTKNIINAKQRIEQKLKSAVATELKEYFNKIKSQIMKKSSVIQDKHHFFNTKACSIIETTTINMQIYDKYIFNYIL